MEFLALFNSIPPTPWQEESGDWKQKGFHLLMGLQEGVCWTGVVTRATATAAATTAAEGERPSLGSIFVCWVVNIIFVGKTLSVLYAVF